jgi:phosphatidylserine decarboxylase
MVATFLDSRLSIPLIAPFVRRNGIDLEEYEARRYRSFNDFFIRRRKPEYAKLDLDPHHLMSPCDGLLSVYPITPDCQFAIKHSTYRLPQLLRDPGLARRLIGGWCLVFRMTPQHYHRYCYPDDAVRTECIDIPGLLHCVRPLCRETQQVFLENSRSYTALDTDHFGCVVQMEVGALLVGRICNQRGSARVRRGAEKGFFAFGGSTILLLLEPGQFQPCSGHLEATRQGREVPVRQGQCVGTAWKDAEEQP